MEEDDWESLMWQWRQPQPTNCSGVAFFKILKMVFQSGPVKLATRFQASERHNREAQKLMALLLGGQLKEQAFHGTRP